jgi:hypothetical protein
LTKRLGVGAIRLDICPGGQGTAVAFLLSMPIVPSHQAKDRIVNEISNAFLLVFAGLFPVVNPLGAAPLFLSLTADCTPPRGNGWHCWLLSTAFGSWSDLPCSGR